MPSPNPDDMLLLIRCPSCGQRFKVGEDLRGRTVECGGCEHRFRIGDDVIVRGKKFYPGERKDPTLNRFHRVPLAVGGGNPSIPSVQYADAPDPVSFEPTSPLRVLAGIVGVAAMVFMALLLMFGASRGGTLDGMTTDKRLLMAGFTGLLGISLLVYGNPRGRLKALGFGLLLTTGLMSLPFFFTDGSVPLRGGAVSDPVPENPDSSGKPDKPSDDEDDLRATIGTGPLEDEIARLAEAGSTRKAVGLWIRNLSEPNRYVVRDYILRVTRADLQSHYYPRGDGDFLMVVTGIDQSLEEMAEIAAPLGTVVRIYPKLQIVEVRVNNDGFRSGPMEKLTDRENPAFYDLNKRELESIDLTRVSDAVKRLAEAPPKIYRSDITRKLISLLGDDWVDFKGDICRALAVWSEQPGPAGEAALKEARKLMDHSASVPEEMVSLIVKEKTPGVIPVLDALWKDDATRWESLYGDVGPAAEATLIQDFSEAKATLRYSAVRILGRVGGKDSLPVLKAANEGADSEMKILISNAVGAIRQRVGP